MIRRARTGRPAARTDGPQQIGGILKEYWDRLYRKLDERDAQRARARRRHTEKPQQLTLFGDH